MNHQSKRWVLGVGVGVSAGMLSCGTLIPTSMLTNGEVTHARESNGKLYGPWHGANSEDGAIPARNGANESPENTFTLTFDSGFLRYLPDIGGVNEVVIAFTFEDAPIQNDKDKIVKILGPILRQPDGALLPEISKIAFGPTALQGRYLSVAIDVYEFDRDEANDRAALIDFIGSAAQSFAIADPATAAEIRLAKEIGKLLAETDQNDLIFHASFDLVPHEPEVWRLRDTVNPTALPLRTGSFALVKAERPFVFFQFFPASRRVDFEECGFWPTLGNGLSLPFAVAVDLIALPITGLMRALTDVPDTKSMVPLELVDGTIRENSRWYEGAEILFDPDSRTLRLSGSKGVYDAKSWLTFSISRGHDAIPIAVRGHLTESEARIAELLKTAKLSDLLRNSKIQEAIDALVKVREAAQASPSATAFDLIAPKRGFFDQDKDDGTKVTDLVVEFSVPKKVEFQSAELSGKALPGGAQFTTLSGAAQTTLESARSMKFTRSDGFPVGEYELVVRYKDDQGAVQLSKSPLRCVLRPTVALSAAAKAVWGKGTKILPLEKTAGDFQQVRAVIVEFEDSSVESLRIVNDPGSSDGISADTIELQNTTGKDVFIKSITLKRMGDLSDVVVTKS